MRRLKRLRGNRFIALSMMSLISLAYGAEKDPKVYITSASADEPIIVVGEFQSKEFFDPCENKKCYSLNGANRVKYRVKQVLVGRIDDPSFYIEVSSHFDSDLKVLDYRTVLMLARRRKNGTYVMSKYDYEPVYPTRSNRWASCERDAGEEFRGGEQFKYIQEIDFVSNVVLGNVSQLTPRGIEDQFPSVTYQMIGNQVHCHKGVYAEDLAPFLVTRAAEWAAEKAADKSEDQ